MPSPSTDRLAPKATMMAKVAELCRFIERHADTAISLDELGQRVTTSPFHLQRSFRAIVGVTPRQYQQACRVDRLKHALRHSPSVTDAIYEAGFGSSSRVYEKADAQLGMTPRQYRQGGEAVAITYVATNTSIGRLMLAATDRGLCFAQLGDSDGELEARLQAELPRAALAPMCTTNDALIGACLDALRRYLQGAQRTLDLPLDVRGTAFQIAVWRYLQAIPYGELRSYAQVARGIGRPSATRAVANACGANRVGLVIPCHRVIRGDGSLGGFRWGIDRKQALLARERAALQAPNEST